MQVKVADLGSSSSLRTVGLVYSRWVRSGMFDEEYDRGKAGSVPKTGDIVNVDPFIAARLRDYVVEEHLLEN